MISLILSVAMCTEVLDLPIRRGANCSNGTCSAPVAVAKKPEVRKLGFNIEIFKNDRVFRGGNLRFKLRGSCCS